MEKVYEIEFVRKGRVCIKADSSVEALDIANHLSEYGIKWEYYWEAMNNKELSQEETKNVVCANEKAESGELMFVTHYVIGTFVPEVMASDVHAAIKKADKKINSANFGELCCTDTELTLPRMNSWGSCPSSQSQSPRKVKE